MAYVPPALRKEARGSARDATLGMTTESAGSRPPDAAPPKSIADLTFSQADIHSHYWASRNDENGTSSTFFGGLTPSTLNSSAQNVDKLKYIMLFHDVNPRWYSHGIIFVKSKLHILPGGEKFKEDLLPEVSENHTEQPGDTENKRSNGTQEKTTFTEKAVVSTNEAPNENVLVEGGQVGHKLPSSQKEVAGKEKREHDEKGEPPEEIEKSSGVPNKSAQYADMPANDHSDNTRAKSNSGLDSDNDYEPNAESPYSPDLSTYDIEPIAVFEQVTRHQRSAQFRFAGYHKISLLEYLAPHSRELFQLLEQKFTTTDRMGRVKQRQRSAVSWRSSLRHRWAVIGMEQDEDANASLPPPKIEVRNDSMKDGDASFPKKSVNQLLNEMRLEG